MRSGWGRYLVLCTLNGISSNLGYCASTLVKDEIYIYKDYLNVFFKCLQTFDLFGNEP